MTTVGFELEVSGGAGNVLAELRNSRLTGHQRLHPYHCDCNACDPYGPYLFKAQEDCTADGEFISSVLEYGSPRFEQAVAGISHALLKADADTSGRVGNHVHVDGADIYDDTNAQLRLLRLMGRYERELFEIAAGRESRMRNYNGDSIALAPEVWDIPDWNNRPAEMSCRYYGGSPGYLMGGSLLAFKPATVEFRLWNSTRQAWRIRTHVGLSVAMLHAALAGEDATRNDRRILEDVIGDYIDGPTWAGILRQRFSKGGFNAADIAA